MSKVKYNSGDGIIEIKTTDDSGAKQEHFKNNMKDRNRLQKISTFVFKKYEVDLTPDKTDDDFYDF